MSGEPLLQYVEMRKTKGKKFLRKRLYRSVPRTHAALPTCKAIEIRCFKKLPARWSSCERHSILQRRVMKTSLLSPKEPCTSRATGWKMHPYQSNRGTSSSFEILLPWPWLLGCTRSFDWYDWARGHRLPWHPIPVAYPFPKESW